MNDVRCRTAREHIGALVETEQGATCWRDINRMSRFLGLSGPRQALVRLCQSINHGHIEALRITDGEPIFTPAPTVLVDVKLDQDESPRRELELRDFELCDELCRLMRRMDGLKDGKVSRLEIRGGVPRRVIFESTVTDCDL
jgi:hypothetical protein